MSRTRQIVTVPLVLGLFGVTLVEAQTPPAPVHKHYEKPADAEEPGPGMPLAPRLQNLGVHTFPVSTRHARAQLFMNQGLNLAYAFNHAEAARAFAEAARLDPNLAMAYAGQALVLGPNINAPMDPEAEPLALQMAQKAVALKGKASPRERAWIDAIATRYTGKSEERAANDRAFAAAMREVARAFPDDHDARTIYAEALMDTMPWNYWTRDGKPYAETVLIREALEHVLATHESHPGALHLWIHLWEATDTPEKAEAEADRLLPLMPGAGHIVHMPAHIYQRVGRHADVISSNILAAKADEDYIMQCKAQGIYPLGYYPHNLHFIWMGASASGRGQLALESAQRIVSAIPHDALGAVPILQGFVVVPYWAMVRFGKWDQLLDDKGPHHDTPFTRAAWRYARGMAYTAKGRLEEAEIELAYLKALLKDPALQGQATFSSNTAVNIMRIAPEVIAGEIAAKRKQWDAALLHLERAVRFEDSLIYTEPADWHAPARQNLGAVLMEMGRADEAEVVFWEDLKRNPENGWSLFGLVRALKAQGKEREAALAEERFRKAWKDADVQLTAARIGSEE